MLACGSSSSGAPSTGDGSDAGGDTGIDPTGECATSSTGSLVVTINGLPSGVNAKVTITKGSDSQTVAATQTLPIPSGDYTVTADIVGDTDALVRHAYAGAVSVASASVCDGKTSNVDVTYTLIPTSHHLWWGNQNATNATLGYDAADLGATGAPVAGIEANTEGGLAGAFDHDGNLYVIDGVSKSVKVYLAATLAASGTKTPDRELTSDAFSGGVPGPSALAFDAKGNLFVGVTYSKAIVEIDSASVAAGGAVTPMASLTTLPDAPQGLAFDSTGALWVASAGSRILKYTGLTGSPIVTIEAQTPSPVIADLTDPIGLAFDASKNLWVNYDGTFAKLTPADQAINGIVTPTVIVHADVASLPTGIAFDESGGLWFAYSTGKFAALSSAQLGTSSASLAPAVIVTSTSVGSALDPAFYPAPATLSLFSSVK